MRTRFPAALLLLLGVAAPASAQPGGADEEARVETGQLRGQHLGPAVVFRNIPYARPPVGALRWRPPRPAITWRGVRGAIEAGPDCIGGDRSAAAGAEDCLTLSVWEPYAPLGGRVPVVVWFHDGGAAVHGGAFADEYLVFVSVNYRLGRFGTFAHPALAGEARGAPSGNFALMDQIAALQWIRRNIGQFGGDPDRIVLMGQGAAGGSVLVLMTSPAARGLFHRVILQSPAHPGPRDSALPDFAAMARVGIAFARRLGLSGNDARVLGALRALPAASLAEDPAPRGPMIDGTLVVEPPEAALRAGRQARVPILVGANGFEDETAILEPARFVAQAMARAGQPVWHYRFSYVAAARRGQSGGAVHGSEIPFLLDDGGADASARDRSEARSLVAYWTAFASTGDPNIRYSARWEPFDLETGRIMQFTDDARSSGPDPRRARLDALQALREGATSLP
ncbi:MAG TPA: carboxylesterase family protein [Allosphingosinicella sp.]|jgi:para-nitrobenzyl esterase|nr:carboxylesterase family protein [Allosphingosinicella sp.]